VRLFAIETQQLIYSFENIHQSSKHIFHYNLTFVLESIKTIAIFNQNKYFVTGSADNTIKIFDIETKQMIHQYNNVHYFDRVQSGNNII